MTKADKAVVKCTLISCSTGTEVEDKVLGRQAEAFSYKGKKSKIKFREFVRAKVEIDASDNRTLQIQVERRTRNDRIDGDPIFDKIFEENTDQVKGSVAPSANTSRLYNQGHYSRWQTQT